MARLNKGGWEQVLGAWGGLQGREGLGERFLEVGNTWMNMEASEVCSRPRK